MRLCGFGGDRNGIFWSHDLRQWCNNLHVRLWEVTGSAINTTLVPVFVNLINQMNDIVFLQCNGKENINISNERKRNSTIYLLLSNCNKFKQTHLHIPSQPTSRLSEGKSYVVYLI